MAEVSEEMILDYLLKKGGVVRNVDLVRHFRKYLQIESASEKERARVIFKERVNRVASIKADTKQEKYLYLRPEYYPPGLARPPTGRSQAADHASVSSLEDVASHASQGANRFSISSILSEAPSVRSPSGIRDSDSDVVAHSFAPIASPPPRTTTITSPITSPSSRTPTIVSPSNKPPPTHQAPPTTAPSTMSTFGNSQLKGLGDDDFGASLMAEFNNFGSLLDSFGISDKTSSSKPSSTSSSSALPASSSGSSSVGGSSSKYGIPTKSSYSSSSAVPAAQTSTNSYGSYASNSTAVKPSSNTSSPAKSSTNSYGLYSNYASNSAAAKPASNSSSPAKSSSNSYSHYSNYASNSTSGSKPTSYSNYDNSSGTTAKSSSSSYGAYDSNSGTTAAKPSSTSYSNYDNSTAKSTNSSYSSYDSRLVPQQSSTSYSTSSASVSAPTTQPSTSAYNALPAGMRPNPTPYTPPMRTSPAPQRTSPAPQRTSPAPQTVPAASMSTPQPTPSPLTSASAIPQKQAPTQKATPSSNGLPKGGGDLDLTDILSSLPSAKTKKPAKPASGRGQTGDMDLTDVLSSLPSANKPPSGASRAPGRTGTTFTSAKPPTHNSFQNSTRFPQPQAAPQTTPTQPSYQNSTKFPQPQAPPTQASYQNSTRFPQPQAPPTQSSYQNSTRFPQPQAPPTQALPTQSSYQNSTRFAQPQAPPIQPQAPPTQNSFQNSTKFSQAPPSQQAPPTQPQAPPLQQGSNWSALASSDRGNQSSSNATSSVQSQQNQEPSSGGQRRPGPPAPTRTSSISRGSSQSSVPLSTDQRATTTSRRTAPLPPTPQHTTHPQPHPSTDTTHPPSPGHASLGNLDLGDLASSMFSTSAGSSHSASSLLSGHTHNPSLSPHNSDASLGHTHHGEEPGKTGESQLHSLGPSVSLPPSNGGRGMGSLERRQLSGDVTSGGHLRQGSTDSTPGTPSIRVESPTGASANGSPSHKRGKSPPYSDGGRGRMSSFGSVGSGLGVQLRNKDGKRNTNVAARRSKNMEKQAGNLDSITRLSISNMTPPAVRKHRPPPEVAPKPPRSPSSPSPSYDSRGQQGSLEGEDDLHSEYDYEEIDPLEKEWMLACAQADIDALQRLMMTDSSLLNRRGFLHGYTALHWAAKHGRMDILSMLLLQGATPDVRSGLTPLHLAAQAGHDNILEILVSEHNANISLRENGGRRPIDMLNNKVSDRVRGLLSKLHNHGMPVKVENQQLAATFSRPRENRHWKPLGEIMLHHAPEPKAVKKRRGTNLMKSISFKRDNRVRDHVTNSPKKGKTKKGRPVSGAVPDQDKPSKRSSGSRPHSEAGRFDI